jgi:hypothetical protein
MYLMTLFKLLVIDFYERNTDLKGDGHEHSIEQTPCRNWSCLLIRLTVCECVYCQTPAELRLGSAMHRRVGEVVVFHGNQHRNNLLL